MKVTVGKLKIIYNFIKNNLGSCLSWAITFAWLIFIYLKIKNGTLPPSLNEFGDFIAGAFAPLAFFWLVRGFYQQGKGLKQNSEALILQAQELQQSTLALQQQATELNATAEGQKILIEIAAQELKHKRFEAEPNFVFSITNLEFDEDQTPDEFDEDGNPISCITEDIVRFNLVFKNIGPNARRVILKNKNGSKIFEEYEVKQKPYIMSMAIYDQEYNNLKKGKTIYKDYEFSFSSIYGDQYLKSVECQVYIVVDHEGEHLGYSISRKDLEPAS